MKADKEMHPGKMITSFKISIRKNNLKRKKNKCEL